MELSFRIRLITTLSATLEFYDFTLFIFLAPAIAYHFFPASSGFGSIMPVLILFFSGYLARFIGGLFYGHGGDTRGRKPYYMNSMIIMSLSTLGIALVPGSDLLGSIAPLLLLVLRILQGLSLGGEVPGSLVYAAEYSRKGKRALATCLIVSGLMLGNVLASAVVSLIYYLFGEPAVNEWAWRIPFACGSALGIISLWLRYALDETPVYHSLSSLKKQSAPCLHLLKFCRFSLLKGVSLASVPAVAVSTLFYIPRFQIEYLKISDISIFSLSFIIFSLIAALGLVFSICSDKIGRLPFIRCSALTMILLVPGATYLLVNGYLSLAWSLTPLILSLSMINGVYEASMIELFSTENRYSGVALCHNLAYCLFGGATPMLLEWLCSHGWLIAPGIWPALTTCLLMLLAFRWKDNYQKELKNI